MLKNILMKCHFTNIDTSLQEIKLLRKAVKTLEESERDILETNHVTKREKCDNLLNLIEECSKPQKITDIDPKDEDCL